MAFIGLLVGGIVGGVLPIHFERVKAPGVEAVQLKVLGVVVRQSAGGPGELDRALSATRIMLVGGLGLLGAVALGCIGALVDVASAPPPPQTRPPSP